MTDNENLVLNERKSAPIFPMGFRFGVVGEMCVIDFIDIPNEAGNVFSSIAITKHHARELVANLSRFIGDEDGDADNQSK